MGFDRYEQAPDLIGTNAVDLHDAGKCTKALVVEEATDKRHLQEVVTVARFHVWALMSSCKLPHGTGYALDVALLSIVCYALRCHSQARQFEKLCGNPDIVWPKRTGNRKGDDTRAQSRVVAVIYSISILEEESVGSHVAPPGSREAAEAPGRRDASRHEGGM